MIANRVSVDSAGAGVDVDACPLRIFGVCADRATHQVALDLLHWLAAQREGETRISTFWFSFERLALRAAYGVAADQIGGAHMFLYAGCGDELPPASVNALLDTWSQGAAGADRLIVALICRRACREGSETAAESFLQDLVQRAGLSLFLQRVDCASVLRGAQSLSNHP